MSKHFLTGMEFNLKEWQKLIALAKACKQNPSAFSEHLKGRALILLFAKPSFRTRLSFTRAMQLLGGAAIESVASTRKPEPLEDLVQVIAGYADAVMLRTHEDKILTDLAKVAKIPIINGLTALHHPCQIFADLCLLEEIYHDLAQVTLCYVGAGNNILHSLLLLAPLLGVKIHYSCPLNYAPDKEILELANTLHKDKIKPFKLPQDAVKGVDAVYTDVWQSMGFKAVDPKEFALFQVNAKLMSLAAPNALFLHCMPMQRGVEVAKTLPDSPCSKIFMQSEYRLYAQMALLMTIIP
ncbi:MAG: hypothetical protein A3F18_03850 [Legionellales bacterium RIFCSPHIGHO2_12_FULL_37_14]|nr:MAG: hypothetical protein A3F18_03850 [Legionellales bacterium RIFCSPHIGHO2_12_FULL_37_14]